MRMDRYEDDNLDALKKSRTDKNQELYTDVYLNNAYVNISEINEISKEDSEEEKIKKELDSKKIEIEPYTYEEKNYDINSIITEAIKNNSDNLKRSLEETTEIESIIKSINENQIKKEKEENLLENLLPDSNTTSIIKPLDEAIVNTDNIDTSIIHKDEMSDDMLKTLEIENKVESSKEHDYYDTDDSFKNETKSSKKIIFIIISIIILICIIIGLLIFKKIIKF